MRCNIRRYLERSRGVVCGEEQIVICSGLQLLLGFGGMPPAEIDRGIALLSRLCF